jgi:hypothetical protein
MRSESSLPIRRRRRGETAATPPPVVDVPAPSPKPDVEVFACRKCRRDFPLIERSRVAIGVCRACA